MQKFTYRATKTVPASNLAEIPVSERAEAMVTAWADGTML